MMPKNYAFLCIFCLIAVTGCNVSNQKEIKAEAPVSQKTEAVQYDRVDIKVPSLKSWWSYLEDDILDRLVQSSLHLKTGQAEAEKHSADTSLTGLERYYEDGNAKHIQKLVETYLQYRSLQGQEKALAEFIVQQPSGKKQPRKRKSIHQEKDAVGDELAQAQKTRNALAEEKRKIEKKLADETGLLPEYVTEILSEHRDLPKVDIKPVLGTSAQAFTVVPKIKALHAFHRVNSANLDRAFENVMIGELFGIPELAYVDDSVAWNLKAAHFEQYVRGPAYAGSAFDVSIEEELQSFQRLLIKYSELGIQYETLVNAYNKTKKYNHKSTGHKAIYDKKIAVLKAHYERLKTLTSIYSYFGVY